MVKLVCVDFLDLMVTSIFPFFFSSISLPSLLECCPALHCGCMSRAGNGVWAFCCGEPCSMTLPRVALVPYCSTLLYVCLFDFPSESSHGARCYASHCVCSNNICHKCSLRCNSHSQPGLLIYSFVPYRQLEIGALMSMGVWIWPLVGLHILSESCSTA